MTDDPFADEAIVEEEDDAETNPLPTVVKIVKKESLRKVNVGLTMAQFGHTPTKNHLNYQPGMTEEEKA